MKREIQIICFLGDGVVFMLRNASDAKSGSDTVYKQVVVEIPHSDLLAYPVFGLMEKVLCMLSEAAFLKASDMGTC